MEWNPKTSAVVTFFVGLFVLIGYIAHEVILHSHLLFAEGLNPLVKSFWSGGGECIKLFWAGGADFVRALAAGIGPEAASIAVVSCVAIPITIVSTYTIFRKTKDKSKALIVAVALFLDPLFIDFFKGEFGENDALRKILIDATGVVTFLAASYFWSLSNLEEKPGQKRSRTAVIALRGTAVLLFLIPSLAMLGFIARKAAGDWGRFTQAIMPEEMIGLAGLLVVATVGIGLSRYFEGP